MNFSAKQKVIWKWQECQKKTVRQIGYSPAKGIYPIEVLFKRRKYDIGLLKGDLLHGICKFYREDGTLKSIEKYNEGKLLDSVVYEKNRVETI